MDYVPVSNCDGVFASAGAALNHGAAQCRHDYIVFAHQDVYLHSLAALEEAAESSPKTRASASWALSA